MPNSPSSPRVTSTPADAAASAGFSDQAHFNRWFKRTYGITPGTFQRAVL
ncbi:helix-turn-helix domain-containing protein [Streptomyces avermitilis]